MQIVLDTGSGIGYIPVLCIFIAGFLVIPEAKIRSDLQILQVTEFVFPMKTDSGTICFLVLIERVGIGICLPEIIKLTEVQPFRVLLEIICM